LECAVRELHQETEVIVPEANDNNYLAWWRASAIFEFVTFTKLEVLRLDISSKHRSTRYEVEREMLADLHRCHSTLRSLIIPRHYAPMCAVKLGIALRPFEVLTELTLSASVESQTIAILRCCKHVQRLTLVENELEKWGDRFEGLAFQLFPYASTPPDIPKKTLRFVPSERERARLDSEAELPARKRGLRMMLAGAMEEFHAALYKRFWVLVSQQMAPAGIVRHDFAERKLRALYGDGDAYSGICLERERFVFFDGLIVEHGDMVTIPALWQSWQPWQI
jgi:hypothetical protein